MTAVSTRPRSPALASLIGSIHYQEAELPEAKEFMLPTGQVHLLVNLYEDEFRTYGGPERSTVQATQGAVLLGARSQAAVIDTREQRCLLRVNFKLGGATPFFPLPLSEAKNQFLELDRLWGRDGAVLRERLLEARTPRAKFDVLEAALLEHLLLESRQDRVIPCAAFDLERGLSVAHVGSRMGLLPKTLERRFGERIGLSPKKYARVRRLQRVLRSIGNTDMVDWSETAATHGFTDQAHFIHDFRDLTGITPTAYRPRKDGERNHVPLDAEAI